MGGIYEGRIGGTMPLHLTAAGTGRNFAVLRIFLKLDVSRHKHEEGWKYWLFSQKWLYRAIPECYEGEVGQNSMD